MCERERECVCVCGEGGGGGFVCVFVFVCLCVECHPSNCDRWSLIAFVVDPSLFTMFMCVPFFIGLSRVGIQEVVWVHPYTPVSWRRP